MRSGCTPSRDRLISGFHSKDTGYQQNIPVLHNFFRIFSSLTTFIGFVLGFRFYFYHLPQMVSGNPRLLGSGRSPRNSADVQLNRREELGGEKQLQVLPPN